MDRLKDPQSLQQLNILKEAMLSAFHNHEPSGAVRQANAAKAALEVLEQFVANGWLPDPNPPAQAE